jgi:hypothetical protein
MLRIAYLSKPTQLVRTRQSFTRQRERASETLFNFCFILKHCTISEVRRLSRSDFLSLVFEVSRLTASRKIADTFSEHIKSVHSNLLSAFLFANRCTRCITSYFLSDSVVWNFIKRLWPPKFVRIVGVSSLLNNDVSNIGT